MADRPIFPDTIKTSDLFIEPADTTTLQDLVTAGADGARVSSISCTSDDTAAMIVQLWHYDGTTAHLLGSVSVPTLSGTDGTNPSVSILNQTDMPFLGDDLAFMLEATDKLQASVVATVTTAKKVTLVASYGDY